VKKPAEAPTWNSGALPANQ
jgi:hypothetical protein